uniref:Domain of unknown function at the cortex 1 domain-containing protein n=1 Tax=Chromera velia CCMP2878 TaxID=1169474 RepID=A0A0G4HAM4_9ALVE|eukprot:Cvel_25732.t1-p1 / transcript=Cvel_25732.t1 / gene=Cvel_25732 / organism=Chromera_velia_CCMP2878 / gene_product=hypothetical protein / transcript_product=hypothetical protein / location=Cvel_scaffold2957:16000-19465(+) / protein_length=526 / sequence_SO=supercontig / SO=protein_coding / is_pseudo=false
MRRFFGRFGKNRKQKEKGIPKDIRAGSPASAPVIGEAAKDDFPASPCASSPLKNGVGGEETPQEGPPADLFALRVDPEELAEELHLQQGEPVVRVIDGIKEIGRKLSNVSGCSFYADVDRIIERGFEEFCEGGYDKEVPAITFIEREEKENAAETPFSPRTLAEEHPNPPAIPQLSLVIQNALPSAQPIIPLSRRPVEFETEGIKGRILLLLRTDPLDPVYAPHLKNRRRKFELQMQIKFKRKPRGLVFFGAEMKDKLQLDWIAQGVWAVAMAFAKSFDNAKALHYSPGRYDDGSGTSPTQGGKRGLRMGRSRTMGGNAEGPCDFESPGITYPLAYQMDRMVVTKPDEPLPELGKDIPEPPESVKARKEMFANFVRNCNLRDGETPSSSRNIFRRDKSNKDLQPGGSTTPSRGHSAPSKESSGTGKLHCNDPRAFFDTEHWYTFAIWSTYINLVDWRVTEIPGLGGFSLHRITKGDAMRFVAYDMPTFNTIDANQNMRTHNPQMHPICQKEYFLDLTLSSSVRDEE